MPTCKKCSLAFPNYQVIDGKRRNLSKRSFCTDCSPFGFNNRRDLTRYDGEAKKCTRCKQLKPFADYYARSDPRYKDGLHAECKDCARVRQRHTMRALQKAAIAYKGGRCRRCGFDDCQAALDFHHRDPKAKEFKISSMKTNRLTARIKRELDKCELLCANCHRKEHCGNEGCRHATAL